MKEDLTNVFYTVEDIQKIFNISRSMSYRFIKEMYESQQYFKIIKIGKLYRIPKGAFDKWIKEMGGEL